MKGLLLFFALFVTTAYGTHSRQYTNVVYAANDPNAVPSDSRTYCFQYTWLKDMNNETFNVYVNKTCADKFSAVKPRPLCVDPMLVTDNGLEPDVNWLMKNKYKLVRCPLYDGYTCAKYTYLFDGEVQNVTRYCTKITVNEISMDSGCVTSSSGAHETEVCACNRMIANVPCNQAPALPLAAPLLILLFCLSFIT